MACRTTRSHRAQGCCALGQVTALLKSKGAMSALQPVVAWDPAPVYVSGYTKLREGYGAAAAWLRKAGEVLDDSEGSVQLKTLESLVSEASRIPVSLPDAKVVPACWCGPRMLPAVPPLTPAMAHSHPSTACCIVGFPITCM